MKRVRTTNGSNGSASIPAATAEPWEAALMVAAKEVVAGMTAETARLSIKGRTFKAGGEIYGDFVDLVVAAFAPYRAHYVEAYSGNGEVSFPDCWAMAKLAGNGLPDTNEDRLCPDPLVTDLQSPACGACRWNSWGTALNGGKGKACPIRMRIAVLILGGELTGAYQEPRHCVAAVLDLATTARIEFQKYLRKLVDADTPYFMTLARVTFDDTKDWPAPVWTPMKVVPAVFKDRLRQLVEAGPRLVTESPWPLRDGSAGEEESISE